MKDSIDLEFKLIWIIPLFVFLFFLIFIIFILVRKTYQFYFEEGKVFFIGKNKTIAFDLKYGINITENQSFSNIGFKLIQKIPRQLTLSFFVPKDFDFLNWLQKNVKAYKNENPEAEAHVGYKSYKRLFLLSFINLLLIIFHFLNITYLQVEIQQPWLFLGFEYACIVSFIVVAVKIFAIINKHYEVII